MAWMPPHLVEGVVAGEKMANVVDVAGHRTEVEALVAVVAEDSAEPENLPPANLLQPWWLQLVRLKAPGIRLLIIMVMDGTSRTRVKRRRQMRHGKWSPLRRRLRQQQRSP